MSGRRALEKVGGDNALFPTPPRQLPEANLTINKFEVIFS
jgi:hypothetical protein